MVGMMSGLLVSMTMFVNAAYFIIDLAYYPWLDFEAYILYGIFIMSPPISRDPAQPLDGREQHRANCPQLC